MGIRRENGLLASSLSRSLEPTWIIRLPTTSLLVIHSNSGPCFVYHFRDQHRFQSKIVKFIPRVHNDPAVGAFLEIFVTALRLKNENDAPTQKFDICIRLDSVSQVTTQQTEIVKQYGAVSMLTREKKRITRSQRL